MALEGTAKPVRTPAWPCVVTAFLVVLVSMITVLKTPASLGWDFHLFYAAGKVPASQLYQEQVQAQEQHRLWEAHFRVLREFNFSAFLKPAYYRLALVPLGKLPFWKAFAVWSLAQLLAFTSALYLLVLRYGYSAVWYLPLPLSPCIVTSIVWGQDAGFVFFLVVGALELLLRRRDGWAGVALALGLVKWNTLLFLPLMLLSLKKWKAIAGFAVVAAAEVALSVWVTGWAGVAGYLSMLRGDYADYLAAGMPSLRGILLLAGAPNRLVAVALVAAMCLTLRFVRQRPLEIQFALGVGMSVFLAYHTMIYDLLFLLVPILVLGDRLNGKWKAGVTALFLSPIPNFLGRLTMGLSLLLLVAEMLRAAQSGLERPPPALAPLVETPKLSRPTITRVAKPTRNPNTLGGSVG